MPRPRGAGVLGAMYRLSDIADAIEAALAAEAGRLDLEQSVTGLDALDELQLHPIVAGGLRRAGWGVLPEQRYPQARSRRVESEGERCDLVLTPEGRALADPQAQPTLFDPPDAVALDEALWLEIKVVAQFTPQGPNAGYASQLLSAVRQDAGKLSRDAGILHAALLVILFTQDEHTASHDLAAWLDRCLRHGLPVGAPSLRSFAINDRLGNASCTVALHPVGPTSSP